MQSIEKLFPEWINSRDTVVAMIWHSKIYILIIKFWLLVTFGKQRQESRIPDSHNVYGHNVLLKSGTTVNRNATMVRITY